MSRNRAARLAFALASALPAAAAAAQAAPAATMVTAPDGGRFLLVPTGGPPVIEWVVRTPAGPAEEAEGETGLAYAVARAALAGTTELGALDRAAEAALHDRWDADEQQAARLLLAGQELPAELGSALAAHRTAAAAVADPLGWERALRAAPASASRLSETPVAVLLHLTLPVEALARVADLLVARREDAVLRGLYDELRAARAELAARAAAESWTTVRDEVRLLAYRRHPLGRPAPAAGPGWPPVSRARAREVFQRTHRPDRTTHVLVGGFDAEAVAGVLQRAFQSSGLRRAPFAPPPAMPEPRGEGTGRLQGAFTGVAVAYRAPADADAEALAVAVAWLAEGDASFLARRLRAEAIDVDAVRAMLPFPAGSGAPYALLEVQAGAAQGGDAGRRRTFFAAVEAALDAAVASPPMPGELRAVRARLTAQRLRLQSTPAGVATWLALHFGPDDHEPAASLRPIDATTAGDAAVAAALRGLLVRERRVLVVQEPAP